MSQAPTEDLSRFKYGILMAEIDFVSIRMLLKLLCRTTNQNGR